ncbi:MAG: Gfo/Idh/MocA family oxidoreductase [Acidobacteria bacterium]|nr:Gfo/Idh/MocA family oxidoreductase [Acidobacteriota bacterium]
MANSTLRGALIGCGYFGRIQLEAWRRMEGVEIAAACDPVMERAREAAPKVYTSADRMLDLEKPDFVDIATRPETHLSLVRFAIERRIPAICQKPLAESMKQALAMARLVRESGVRVMVHENWRWQPWYRTARKMMDQGEIGEPLAYQFRLRQRDGLGANPYPNQPYFRQMPRLLIYETLIHPIDTARFLFGQIESVLAHTRRANPLIQGEDRAVVVLQHANAVDGVIDGHRYLDPEPPGPAMGDALFEGERGSIHVLATGDVLLNGRPAATHDTSTGYKGDSVRATQQHFLDCLRSGAPFETGVVEYLESFAAVEAAYRSQAEGRLVRVQEMYV